MGNHQFNPVILREYDIRGVVGQTLNESDAHALGCSFGTFLRRQGGKHVVVGRDGRRHSPMLETALVRGLVSTGVHVERVGMGPTPLLYFALYHRDADAGIMITGSHNPADQNGFKMLLSPQMPQGGPVYGAAIKALAELAEKADYEEGAGQVEDIDVRAAYIKRLLQDYQNKQGLHVVWDNGNGAAGDILLDLLPLLPGKHTLLYGEVDGTFPNHHPDPTVAANLVDLQRAVKEQGADLGVAFDGDADRIGAVDSKGRILEGDQLLALYAREVLSVHQGATIIADVKASQGLFDSIKKDGGVPLMWKTGHSLIKVKMAETNSPLAGEMSGHIFFADKYYGYDDAVYCALRLLGLVEKFGGSLDALRDGLPQMVNTPEVRFEVDEARKFSIVDDVKAYLSSKTLNVDNTDGVRVSSADGWWLLRASNTQNVLVARAEGRDEAALEQLKGQILEVLAACGVPLNPFDRG
ncbi:MAG: phosphoglucomutase/phosphomannomutase PgmG [Bdellovibrionales bacterium]